MTGRIGTAGGAARAAAPASVALYRARAVLGEAAATADADERFRLAHLAALRVCAAVLADRGRPAAARRRLLSAWVLVEAAAPELAEWAGYFAAAARTRAAIEAGALGVVSDRQADDQLRAAAGFLAAVESGLSMLAAPLAS